MKLPRRCSDLTLCVLRAALLGGAALSLAACAETGVLEGVAGEPPATRGFVDGLDGLTVGHRLMEAGEYELALKAYYRAGSQIGVNADVLSAIGSANLRLGRLGQAERTLRMALDEDDRFVPAWNNLGVVLYEQERIGEAREAFRVAFMLDSGFSPEIRENFNRVDAEMRNIVTEEPEEYDFRLVRRGNGRYLLLGTD